MTTTQTYFYKFKLGYLKVVYTDSLIMGLTRVENNEILTNPSSLNNLIIETIKQLDEYFKSERFEFDLPLLFKGTEFQKQVWNALLKIPYGETRSYKEMAQSIGNDRACRAVGGANNKNPIIIICPCHRVIGANGNLVGYGGGMDMKRYLLDLEQIINN